MRRAFTSVKKLTIVQHKRAGPRRSGVNLTIKATHAMASYRAARSTRDHIKLAKILVGERAVQEG